MLTSIRYGTTGPVVVALHWLGGSAHTWTEVAQTMSRRGVRWLSIDLPGFGDAASVAGYTVEAMRDNVMATIRREMPAEALAAGWVLAGHSMGGKVSAAVAREVENGAAGLAGLRGVFLVSPSPPQPEPMDDKVRASMLQSLGESTGDPAKDRRFAADFVDNNTGKQALLPAVHERAVDGVLRMNRTAFRAWLEHGSYEDWRGRVAELQVPALIVAGSVEPALGPDVQREVTLPHYPNGRVFSLEGANHLSPLSRPGQVVELLCELCTHVGLPLYASERTLDAPFAALVASDAVSPQTRALLDTRLADSTWQAAPRVLTSDAFRVLRAVTERVVPDAGFDLASRAEARLGEPDGWRFSVLPPDVDAWELGLMSLQAAAMRGPGVPFTALHAEQQDALLQQAADGSLGKGVLGTLAGALHLDTASSRSLDAAQMKAWFEDVRSLLARLYMADPRTYERIGYTGFADNVPFTQIELGEPDDRFAVAGVAAAGTEVRVNA